MTNGIFPEGWHAVTPRLVVDDVGPQVEFLKQTFDAKGELNAHRPSEITIGDSITMVRGIGPRPAMAAFLHVYVADADDTYPRAIKANSS